MTCDACGGQFPWGASITVQRDATGFGVSAVHPECADPALQWTPAEAAMMREHIERMTASVQAAVARAKQGQQ